MPKEFDYKQRPLAPHVTQERWDAIFNSKPKAEKLIAFSTPSGPLSWVEERFLSNESRPVDTPLTDSPTDTQAGCEGQTTGVGTGLPVSVSACCGGLVVHPSEAGRLPVCAGCGEFCEVVSATIQPRCRVLPIDRTARIVRAASRHLVIKHRHEPEGLVR